MYQSRDRAAARIEQLRQGSWTVQRFIYTPHVQPQQFFGFYLAGSLASLILIFLGV
jgi:hypothetical protein